MNVPQTYGGAAKAGVTSGSVAAVIIGLVVAIVNHVTAPQPKPDNPPTPSPVVAAAPESWIVLDKDGVRVTDSTVEKIAGSLKAGRWTAQGIPKPGEKGVSLTITVDDGVKPPDPPKPPEPPTPPTPPVPPPPMVVVPPELQPAVAALKPFPSQRAQLGKFYADFSAVVATSDLKTTGQFATAHTAALKSFVAASGYAGAPKVGEYIDAYLAACLGGLEDKPLNAELQARLVAALKTIGEAVAHG